MRWAALLVMLPWAAVAAEADTIECADSYVALNLPGEYRCTRGSMESFEAGGGFQGFNLSGRTADGYGVSVRVYRAMAAGSYIRLRNLNQTDDLEDIKKFNKVTREGRNWSAPRQAAGVMMAEFESEGGRRCTGFSQRGGMAENGRGYRWRLTGEFCAPKGKALDTAQADALFSRLSVKG